MTRTTKENDRYVMSRSEDHSFFAAFDYYTTKYKLVLWLLMLAGLAIGFDFKTPKAIFADLQNQVTANKRQVDSVIQPKIDATNHRIDQVNDKMDVLLRLQCVNRTVSQQQAQLSGLDMYCPTTKER